MTEEKYNFLEQEIERRAKNDITRLEEKLVDDLYNNPVAENFLVYDKDGKAISMIDAIHSLYSGSDEEIQLVNKMLPEYIKGEANNFFEKIDDMEKFMKEHKND